MIQTEVDIEALSNQIIGCAIEVHRVLGPGLLESVYRECLIIELRLAGLRVEIERRLPIVYKGHKVAATLVLDLLVEGCFVLELKAVEKLHSVYSAQTITYLKLTGCPAGLLLNFNVPTLKQGMRRLDHPDRYSRKS